MDSRFRSRFDVAMLNDDNHSSVSGDPMDVDSIPDSAVTLLKDILLDTRRRGIRIMMLRY